MLKRIPLLDPVSSRPGVVLRKADFSRCGAWRVPFSAGRFVVAPGATSAPDNHDVTECWIVSQGSGLLNYDGLDYRVSAGECFLFEPKKNHYVHNNGSSDIVIYTMWWLELAV